MNILILSWRGPKHPNAGGAETSTHEHAKGWVRVGHDVTLFTSSFSGGKSEEIIDGVRIKRYGRQMFGVQWEAFRWYLLGDHPKFDVIVDQFHGIPFFTPLYVRGKKLAFIHEVTKEVWKLNPWPRPLNLLPAILGRWMEPLIFLFFYQNIPFMTVSESTKDDLIKWGISENKITVIHNGTSLKKIEATKKESKKTIIYLGALSKDKGIEDALKIFKYLSEVNKGWQFWVVGQSAANYLEKLKKMCQDFGIKNVKFWGFVNEEQKFKLLAKSHILISPSIREGWGLVIIEAASVGTPSVGYNVPGLRDSIRNGKTGILCNPNPEDCADRVVELINNQKRYKNLSANCITWSKNFNWEKASTQSLKLLEKVRG